MISTIDIKINAARPNCPLPPSFAFQGSPSSLRILSVPKAIGNWAITRVYIDVLYPDNTTKEVDCVRTGNVWVGTFEGSTLAGKVTQGISIMADGVDENNQPVEGYCLGKSDYFVLDDKNDIKVLIDKTALRYLEELPTNPVLGDVIDFNGEMRFFNGTSWVNMGGVSKEEFDSTVSQLESTISALDSSVSELTSTVSQLESSMSNFIPYPSVNANDEWNLDPVPETRESMQVTLGAKMEGQRRVPYIMLGEDELNILIEREGNVLVKHLRIGENEIANITDMPTLTSQLTNDSGYPTYERPLHFIKYDSYPDNPNRWYINFGVTSAGGITLCSDEDNPTQSYIDIAGNKITAPGYDPLFDQRGLRKGMAKRDVETTRDGEEEEQEEEDDHLSFNERPLAFVEEVTELDSTVSALSSSVSALDSSVSTMASSITTLESNVSNVAASISTMASSITSIDGSVSAMASSIATLESGVSNVTASVSTMASSIGGLSSAISTIDSTLSTMAGSMLNMSSSISVLSGNVQALTSSVSAMASSMNVKRDYLDLTYSYTSSATYSSVSDLDNIDSFTLTLSNEPFTGTDISDSPIVLSTKWYKPYDSNEWTTTVPSSIEKITWMEEIGGYTQDENDDWVPYGYYLNFDNIEVSSFYIGYGRMAGDLLLTWEYNDLGSMQLESDTYSYQTEYECLVDEDDPIDNCPIDVDMNMNGTTVSDTIALQGTVNASVCALSSSIAAIASSLNVSGIGCSTITMSGVYANSSSFSFNVVIQPTA